LMHSLLAYWRKLLVSNTCDFAQCFLD
jgi:hypothetical protein